MSEHDDIRSVFIYFDKRQVNGNKQHIFTSSELCKCQCLTSVDEDLTIVKFWTQSLRDEGSVGYEDVLWLDPCVITDIGLSG